MLVIKQYLICPWLAFACSLIDMRAQNEVVASIKNRKGSYDKWGGDNVSGKIVWNKLLAGLQ